MLPLSGPYATFGNEAFKAIQLALKHIKSLSGNISVKLMVRDTQSDPKKTRYLVKELDELRVAMIIGPMATIQKAAFEAQRKKIPIITLTQKTGVSDIGDYVFRNFITPEMQVDALLKCAIGQFGALRFAVLYPNKNYGRTFKELFRNKASCYGANLVKLASYAPEQTDLSIPIKRSAKIPVTHEKLITSPHRRNLSENLYPQRKKDLTLNFDAVFISGWTIKGGHDCTTACLLEY